MSTVVVIDYIICERTGKQYREMFMSKFAVVIVKTKFCFKYGMCF